MKNITFILVLIFIILSLISGSSACTTAIITGEHTKDGRPLLWKHRDTGFLQNNLMTFHDGKFKYIGLVNASDSTGKEIWAGCNSAGFAIMNSASYNLNINDTTSLKDQEGVVMKKALQTCATLEDFEKLLQELPKPLGVEANFGVIDAAGGAAYYETTNFDFVKIDANDPKIAPFGYVIRSNYSFSGQKDKGYGYIRYLNAEELFYNAAAVNDLSAEFIIKDVSRSLRHSLTKVDLAESYPQNANESKFVNFLDFIPRYSSTASVIIQGVRQDEPPSLTTMWTILGFQLCSVAVPCWVEGGNSLPKILTVNSKGVAPLCDMALTLKNQCFPIKRGSGKKYINITALLNGKNEGIMQKLQPLENKILKQTGQKLKSWREKGITAKEVREYYQWLDRLVLKEYKRLFDL